MSVTFLDGGRYLLSGGGDGSLRVWDTQTGASRVHAAVETSNGWEQFFGSMDNSHRPPEEQAVISQLLGSKSVSDVGAAVDRLGGQVFACSGRQLSVWDTSDGQKLAAWEGNEARIVAVTPDGQLGFSTGWVDARFQAWHLPSRELVGELTGHTEWVRGLAVSSDGELLASASTDGTVRLWHIPSLSLVRVLTEEAAEPLQSVAFTRDSRYLLAGGKGSRIAFWELEWEWDFPDPDDKSGVEAARTSLRPSSSGTPS